MDKHFLKHLRDQMPDSVNAVIAPIVRNKLIKNNEFIKYYNLLIERDLLDKDAVKNFQLNQLRNILQYAFENVPYYQELFKRISFDPYKFSDFEQLSAIPFLTREIVTDNYEKLISKKRIKNGYYIGFTGGSSGTPLKFLLDYDSIYKENAFIYFYRRKLGYSFKDRVLTFRQVEYGERLWKSNPMHNEVIFFPIRLSKNTVAAYVKKINEYKPQYLNGYLSAIWYFARLMEDNKLKLDFEIKGIFLISENIDDTQRAYIEKFFKTKSTTFYGHSERVVIAEEVLPQHYKFDPYYGYTEKILNENGIYSIVGTGFLNRIMPFIRYKTDDVCSPNGDYYSIEGKRTSKEGLIGINGEFISATAFDLDDPIFTNVTTYQFIQHEKGKADLLLIAGKHFEESELKIITEAIKSKTEGAVDLNIKLVDKLILSPRGKCQMYISTLKEQL